ncbi:hypothetical protein LTS08_003919 [Lithohypha guttulata]|nr:hypothetical protein LTS08_003919 [Lithohypha guttulata]
MAFQQPTVQRQQTVQVQPAPSTRSIAQQQPQPTESQEWILFAPESQTGSSTHHTETRIPGLTNESELGYLNSTGRSGQPGSSILDEEATEDAELDSLDDGLHAFREPTLFPTMTHQSNGTVPVLPAHDGLGSFQASSAPVLEQLWRHEQFNTKRKHEGHHRRPSSVQRHLDTIDEFEAQASEEKRLRIEKWRIDQSQALMEEVEKETRRRIRRSSAHPLNMDASVQEVLGSTPKQSDYMSSNRPRPATEQEDPEAEPFWRRITRKFIKDVIGIDDPLLSVILGESLPGEETPRATSPAPEDARYKQESHEDNSTDAGWRDKVLHRIAQELGVFPSQLTPHPGAFTTYPLHNADYAGMPISISKPRSIPAPAATQTITTPSFTSNTEPKFIPTLRDDTHAEGWGLEEEPSPAEIESSLNLKREREYWERELDVKMVFRYLKDRLFSSSSSSSQEPAVQQQRPQILQRDDSAHRAAIIRQHHPLVNRAHRSSVLTRRDSRIAARRPSSSCASESLKGSRKASALRSGSSRNYWDIGGSVGSGSVLASSGMIGNWGQV